MKSIIFSLILTISIGALSSYPTSTPSKNSENDDLFVSLFKGLPYMGGFNKEFNGVIDTGPRSDVKRWNFLDSVQAIIREFRGQTFHWPHIRAPTGPGLSGLWSKTSDKGNATSTVEVIDGHKVIVNETVYKKQHDFGESIYKVRVVNILPVDEPQDDTIRPITNNNNDDVETIDKSTIDPFAIVESVDDALNKGNDKTDGVTTTTESNINRREELEDHDEDDDEDDDDLKNIDDHHIVKGSPESFDDYSNLADNEISNDVETIESFELKSNNDNKNKNKNQNQNEDNDDIIRNFYYGEKYGSKYLNDEFDSSEFVDDLHYHKKIFDDKLNHAFIDAKDDESPITFKPINLSNDINVNRMFADQQPNYYNPDAELIDIDNFNQNNHNNNNNDNNNNNNNDNNNNENNDNDNDNNNSNDKYYNWNNAAAFDDDGIDYNQSDSETENPVDEFKTY